MAFLYAMHDYVYVQQHPDATGIRIYYPLLPFRPSALLLMDDSGFNSKEVHDVNLDYHTGLMIILAESVPDVRWDFQWLCTWESSNNQTALNVLAFKGSVWHSRKVI
jgi:hypothetical protein